MVAEDVMQVVGRTVRPDRRVLRRWASEVLDAREFDEDVFGSWAPGRSLAVRWALAQGDELQFFKARDRFSLDRCSLYDIGSVSYTHLTLPTKRIV